MTKPGSLRWKLQRYLFRRDVIHKVRSRYEGYRRRAERDPFGDIAEVYQLIGEPHTVLDVGANIGLVSSKLLKQFPASTVHAFEPTPDTAAVLRSRLDSDARIRINETAVSDTIGTVTFNVDNHTHGGGSNSLLSHSAHFATRARTDRYVAITVPATTLDAYATKHGISRIELLKLDIEGAELLALRGAEHLLTDQAVDFIVSEVRFISDYVGQPLFGELEQFLGEHEYTLFNLYSPAESGTRQALFADAVFVSNRMRREPRNLRRTQVRLGPGVKHRQANRSARCRPEGPR